jgi:chromate transporter
MGFDHDQSSTAKRKPSRWGRKQEGNSNGWFWPNGSGTFLVFLRLGLTSFGGPMAHLGYFRQEFVERRKWLSEQTLADPVALCNFLPGPTSSQVCYSIGMTRGGIPDAISAWSAFTIPSAIIMLLAAYGIHWLSGSCN